MELACLTCYLGYGLLIFVAYAIFKYFIRPGVNLKQYGDWAVVTGATDGIGKALCFELAKAGLNIVLISRTTSKLKETASEIESKYPKVQTSIVQVDYGNFDAAAKSRVKAAVDPLDVAVLVNNVGMSYSFPQNVADLKEDQFRTLLELNVSSTVEMTQLLLPRMEQRKKGIIVNMSSASSALGGCPMLALYAASKAYINEFSSSLHYEYSGSKCDIRVQAQIPLFVTTKLAKIRKARLDVPSPATFAKASVRAMGHEPLISPYWVHALMVFLGSFVPQGLLMTKVRGMHKGLNKRALAKAKREQ
jgi:17beta-estradiol 17-dehydrogenase / very-long-chain 3-oxoacyl-CoA reductase